MVFDVPQGFEPDAALVGADADGPGLVSVVVAVPDVAVAAAAAVAHGGVGEGGDGAGGEWAGRPAVAVRSPDGTRVLLVASEHSVL